MFNHGFQQVQVTQHIPLVAEDVLIQLLGRTTKINSNTLQFSANTEVGETSAICFDKIMHI